MFELIDRIQMNETNNNNILLSGKAKKVNSNKNRKRNYCP